MSWLYSLTFWDNYNGVATRSYDLVAANYAAARIVADAMLAAAQGWTDLAIVKDSLAEVEELADTPDAASNVDRGATMQFDLGGNKRGSLNFPSPLMTTINPDRSVDLADALVTAWTVIFTGGDATLSDGDTTTTVIKGVLDR